MRPKARAPRAISARSMAGVVRRSEVREPRLHGLAGGDARRCRSARPARRRTGQPMGSIAGGRAIVRHHPALAQTLRVAVALLGAVTELGHLMRAAAPGCAIV